MSQAHWILLNICQDEFKGIIQQYSSSPSKYLLNNYNKKIDNDNKILAGQHKAHLSPSGPVSDTRHGIVHC